MTQAQSEQKIDAVDLAVACAALERAGVTHAQLREHYATVVLEAIRAAQPVLCGDKWDEQQVCSLPAGHGGWHASSPVYDHVQQHAQAGGTWSGRSPARYGV